MFALAKHFLNTPESLVLDSLEGLCAVNPHLALDSQNKGDRCFYEIISDPSQTAAR